MPNNNENADAVQKSEQVQKKEQEIDLDLGLEPETEQLLNPNEEKLREVLKDAGFGEMISKLPDDKWLQVVCDAGILRDGNGNKFEWDLSTKENRERLLNHITDIKNGFYVADKDSGEFHKYGKDRKTGEYSARQSETPEAITERPGIILRILHALGFRIEAVENYNKQLEQLRKKSPNYDKINTKTSKDASKDFEKAASKLIQRENTKQANREKQAQKKLSDTSAALDKLIKANDKKMKSVPEDSPLGLAYKSLGDKLSQLKELGLPGNPPTERDAEKVALLHGAVASLALADAMEKSANDFALEDKFHFRQSSPEAQSTFNTFALMMPMEDIVIKVGANPIEKFYDLITDSNKLTDFVNNLAIGAKKPQEAKKENEKQNPDAKENEKQNPDAKENKVLAPDAAKKENVVQKQENVAANEAKVADNEAKAPKQKKEEGVVDEKQPVQNGENKNEKEPEKEIKENVNNAGQPAAQPNQGNNAPKAPENKGAVKPDAVKKESVVQQKQNVAANEANAAAQKSDLLKTIRVPAGSIQLNKLMTEIRKQVQNIDPSSTLGIAIHALEKNLQALENVGLPNEKEKANNLQKQAATKVVSSMNIVNTLQNAAKDPAKKDKLMAEQKASFVQKQTKEIDKAIEQNLFAGKPGADNVQKIRDVINDPKAANAMAKESLKVIKENPEMALLPKGSIRFENLYIAPGTNQLQRMPGANEDAVAESLDHLKNLPPDAKFVQQFNSVQQKHKFDAMQNNAKKLEERTKETEDLLEVLDDCSMEEKEKDPIYLFAMLAKDSMDRLRSLGMPADGRGFDNPERKDALLTAAASAVMLGKFARSPKIHQQFMNLSPEKQAEAFHRLKNRIERTTGNDELMRDVLDNRLLDNPIRSKLNHATVVKRDLRLPKQAEVKGPLFRLSANDEWQILPNTTLKQRNNVEMDLAFDNLVKKSAQLQKNISNPEININNRQQVVGA